MSAWTDAEDADEWAAEQARVDEWARQHEHPLTAALRQRDQAMAALYAVAGIDTPEPGEIDFSEVLDACRRLLSRLARAEASNVLLTARLGRIREETLREVEEKGQFVYETDEPALTAPETPVRIHRRRLLLDGESPW